MTATTMHACNDQPRTVYAPEDALGWAPATNTCRGGWVTEDEYTDISDGDLPTVERDRDRWVEGVTGCAHVADVMELQGQVDRLAERVNRLETAVGAMAVVASSVNGHRQEAAR